MKSAHATTAPLLVPLLLLDVVGADVTVGAGVAPGEGVAVVDEEEPGAGVGDGVVALKASLFEDRKEVVAKRREEKTANLFFDPKVFLGSRGWPV